MRAVLLLDQLDIGADEVFVDGNQLEGINFGRRGWLAERRIA